jgi:branched-chain amino acid transport system permease protein
MLEFVLQFLASSLTEGCVYALMALGLVIILRATDVLFFVQGSIAMVGGVTIFALFAQRNIPLFIAIPVSLIVCIIVALLTLRLIVLPLLSRGAPSMSVSIVTIGVSMLIEMAAMLIFGKDNLAVPSFSGDDPVTIFGASFVPQHFWIIGFTAVALMLTFIFFKWTLMGKAMTGLGDNQLLAKAIGFPVNRLFMYSFIFSALVGGIAGIVFAPISYTGFGIGTRLTIKGFAAAAVGGITNPVGALAGGLIIGLFESFTAGFISSRLKDLITMALLLLVLWLRPQGLFGKKSQ